MFVNVNGSHKCSLDSKRKASLTFIIIHAPTWNCNTHPVRRQDSTAELVHRIIHSYYANANFVAVSEN